MTSIINCRFLRFSIHFIWDFLWSRSKDEKRLTHEINFMLPFPPIGNANKTLFVPPDDEVLKPKVNSISLTQELSSYFDINMNIPMVDSAFGAFLNGKEFNDSIQNQINEAKEMHPLSLSKRLSQMVEMQEEPTQRNNNYNHKLAPSKLKSTKSVEKPTKTEELAPPVPEIKNKTTRFIESLPQDEELVEKQDGMIESLSRILVDQFRPVESRLVLQHPTKKNLKVKAVYPIVPPAAFAGQESYELSLKRVIALAKNEKRKEDWKQKEVLEILKDKTTQNQIMTEYSETPIEMEEEKDWREKLFKKETFFKYVKRFDKNEQILRSFVILVKDPKNPVFNLLEVSSLYSMKICQSFMPKKNPINYGLENNELRMLIQPINSEYLETKIARLKKSKDVFLCIFEPFAEKTSAFLKGLASN